MWRTPANQKVTAGEEDTFSVQHQARLLAVGSRASTTDRPTDHVEEGHSTAPPLQRMRRMAALPDRDRDSRRARHEAAESAPVLDRRQHTGDGSDDQSEHALAARDPALHVLTPAPSHLLQKCVRLSALFAPTLRAESLSPTEQTIPSLALLLRGGFLRQSSAGVYTLLPLGHRVLRRISDLVEDEMDGIGASRLDMPNLLSSSAWRRSGRWDSMGSELFKLPVRGGGGSSEYLLGPTHEEEVTQLVGGEVASHKQLPVKVYQITRKFRNEPRPKSGLLRTREFYMKDLYTFDADVGAAKAAYAEVRAAYGRIFDRLLGRQHGPWLSAAADTGAIGGELSHEYHLADSLGEDTLLSCNTCGFAANQELALSAPSSPPGGAQVPIDSDDLAVQLFEEADESRQATSQEQAFGSGATPGQLFAVVTARGRQASASHVSRAARKITGGGASAGLRPVTRESACFQPEQFSSHFDRVVVLVDQACTSVEQDEIVDAVGRAVGRHLQGGQDVSGEAPQLSDLFPPQSHFAGEGDAASLQHESSIQLEYGNLKQAVAGDQCLTCAQSGKKSALVATQSIEIGHTFLLGTKYSEALNAGFTPSAEQQQQLAARGSAGGKAPFQMGCYGIGISRLIGAIASRAAALGGGEQLIWPRSIAPFQVCIVTPGAGKATQANGEDPAVSEALDQIVGALTGGATAPPELQLAETLAMRDIAIDDRSTSVSRKLKDADLIGFPIVLVLGKAWKESGKVEVIIRDAEPQLGVQDKADRQPKPTVERSTSFWQL